MQFFEISEFYFKQEIKINHIQPFAPLPLKHLKIFRITMAACVGRDLKVTIWDVSSGGLTRGGFTHRGTWKNLTTQTEL